MVDFSAVRSGTAYGSDGGKVGKVGKVDEIYTDKDTGEPSFVTVQTGLFGSKTTFVPLSDASVEGKDLRLPHTRAKIKGAPGVEPDVDITDAEQDRLHDYYGVGGHSSTGTSGTGTVPAGGTANDDFVDRERERGGQVGHDVSGPTTDDAMTRSKEELRVGTRREEIGRARMRKYVTTERVSEEVPVSREEVRVTREPIPEANIDDAHDGPAISEEEHEVTLHAERAVADKEVVPVERIRPDTETVRGTERVEAEVREEHIEVDGASVDGDATTRRRHRDLLGPSHHLVRP